MAEADTLEVIVNNIELEDKYRGDSLILLVEEDTERGLKLALSYLLDKSPYLRSAAALALGKSNNRGTYKLLLGLMNDEAIHVRGDAAQALAETKDSRALFALVNFYNAGDYQERVRVLQSLAELKDPRSLDFLDQVLSTEKDEPLLSQAQKARNELRDSEIFLYTYNGPDENVQRAKTIEGQFFINSPEDLDSAAPTIKIYAKSFRVPRPQTYVVTIDGGFVVGGLIQEHVEVARGNDVLAAGEVEFEKKESGGWSVGYINNRSNGYYPSLSSFRYVKAALIKSGVEVSQDRFTEDFPKTGFNDPDFLAIHPFYKKN